MTTTFASREVAVQPNRKAFNFKALLVLVVIGLLAYGAVELYIYTGAQAQTLTLASVQTGVATKAGDLVSTDPTKWNHAYLKHAKVAACGLALSTNMAASEVWMSTGQSNLRENYTSLAFVYNAGAGSTLALAACAGIAEAIAAEYPELGGAVKPNLYKIVVIVGVDGYRKFPVNIYPVQAQPPSFFRQWREWHGYNTCLAGACLGKLQ